ncbi:MAG TPA: TraR/DksA C4-type zinc finger protein [Acidobacteriaceae bacterium]|nr:TraR/DksA C4-type zinc finger protein [Acidobacteriaceae bacterium]
MDIGKYRSCLVQEETRLGDEIARAEDAGADPRDALTGDAADESARGERKEEQFRKADSKWSRLRQVRGALARIQTGTFGHCMVDGGPIEEKRLDAEPWTPYCKKHQEEFERARPQGTPTL